MLTKILIGLALLVLVLLVVVALRPGEFRVVRSAAISAPPGVVFAQVNNLHKWEAWSPWAKLDPAARNTYDGPPSGPGASFSWAGNSQVGEGRMTITDSRPDEVVRFKLEFLKPFKAESTTEFTFKPEGNQTVVAWTMAGKNNFMAKAIGLVMNCDTMLGGQFETGLASLKSVAETANNK